MPALISLEDRVKLRDEVIGSTQERMLREITNALEALSAETPLVIVLEDLQWSDPSTIDFLSGIARRTSPARLMILATYRPSEAARNAFPLLRMRNELALSKQCRVLPLTCLSKGETCEYLTRRCSELHSPLALAAALHERTDGHPLYVACLVDELTRSGRIDADPEEIDELVPDSLQAMFESRVTEMSGPEREMLDAAAVAGESFSISVIAAALGWDPVDAEVICEGLANQHVILRRGATVRFPDGIESGGYSFLHDLCRDALYRRLAFGVRSRLHGALGKAEEDFYAADLKRIAAELAGRFELAGDLSRAIRYLRVASDGAAARYSIQEAAGYLDRALVLVERMRAVDQASFKVELIQQRTQLRQPIRTEILLGCHLTRSGRAFPSLLTTTALPAAAGGGLEPSPARRSRRAFPHRLLSDARESSVVDSLAHGTLRNSTSAPTEVPSSRFGWRGPYQSPG